MSHNIILSSSQAYEASGGNQTVGRNGAFSRPEGGSVDLDNPSVITKTDEQSVKRAKALNDRQVSDLVNPSRRLEQMVARKESLRNQYRKNLAPKDKQRIAAHDRKASEFDAIPKQKVVGINLDRLDEPTKDKIADQANEHGAKALPRGIKVNPYSVLNEIAQKSAAAASPFSRATYAILKLGLAGGNTELKPPLELHPRAKPDGALAMKPQNGKFAFMKLEQAERTLDANSSVFKKKPVELDPSLAAATLPTPTMRQSRKLMQLQA